jgi:hypothetical protein
METKSGLVIAAIGVFVLAAGSLQAAPVITLTNRNSAAAIDVGTQLGQFTWTVDGVNQLAKQWFWYRIGNAPEASIDTMGPPQIVQSAANGLSITYANQMVQVQVDFLLKGGLPGSGASDIAEIITIDNLTGAPLPFHFYQYADFDLNGTSGGDSVQFPNPYVVRQTEGATILSETVGVPASSHREAAFFGQTLFKLNDNLATDLNDVGAAGPGDVTWAFQWDSDIAAHDTWQLSKDKRLTVPEPMTLTMLTLGSLLLARRRRG